MFKDLFSIKPQNIPFFLLVLVSGFLIFILSQFFVFIFAAGILSVIRVTTGIDIDFTAPDTYWPKVVLSLLIGAAIIFLVFKVLELWRSAAAGRPRTKKERQAGLIESLRFLKLGHRPTVLELLDVFVTYALYFVTISIVGVAVAASGLVDVNQAQELGVDAPVAASTVLATFVLFVVLPPITEEILFRGYLYNKLRVFSGAGIAYITTCLLFGSAHLEFGNLNWIAAIDTLVFSVFLIYISQKHQSLYSSMLLHATKNLTAFLLFVYVTN